MSAVQEQLEIRFRLPDGSDIGPNKYSAVTTVAFLKESILAEWTKETKNGLRTVNDLKLINAGKILENSKTLAECRSGICDLSGITTMHVVVRPPSLDRGIERNEGKKKKKKSNRCGCTIL